MHEDWQDNSGPSCLCTQLLRIFLIVSVFGLDSRLFLTNTKIKNPRPKTFNLIWFWFKVNTKTKTTNFKIVVVLSQKLKTKTKKFQFQVDKYKFGVCLTISVDLWFIFWIIGKMNFYNEYYAFLHFYFTFKIRHLFSTYVNFVDLKVFELIPFKNHCMDIKVKNTFSKKCLGTRLTMNLNILPLSKAMSA